MFISIVCINLLVHVSKLRYYWQLAINRNIDNKIEVCTANLMANSHDNKLLSKNKTTMNSSLLINMKNEEWQGVIDRRMHHQRNVTA